MNIAFPAALIFILVLPGIIFHYSYARGSWYYASPTSLQSVSNDLAYGVILALGLHCVWLRLAHEVGHDANLTSLLTLLLANFGKDNALLDPALQSIARHPREIATYFFSLCASAALLGYLTHRLVRGLKLDRSTRIFRFKNDWYYLLTGEVLEFAEVGAGGREIAGVYLSAVIEQGKESYLYRGIVEGFTYDADGNLSLLRLRLAHRRLLSNDEIDMDAYGANGHPADAMEGNGTVADMPAIEAAASGSETSPAKAGGDRYYDIKGDYLLLRYSEMRTLNLEYFSLTPAVEATTSTATSN